MASSKTSNLAKFGLAAVALGSAVSLTLTTLTSSTVTATTAFTGGTLNLNKPSAGSGKAVIHGGDGAYICLRDADNVGWTMISGNNGVVTVNGANSTQCP